MNGNKLFVDTNIIIYLLNGDIEIAQILDGKELVISVITELELLSFADVSETAAIRELISECQVLNLNEGIKNATIHYRKNWKLKLPDSIIAASAYYSGLPLFTADKGFSKIDDINILLYEL